LPELVLKPRRISTPSTTRPNPKLGKNRLTAHALTLVCSCLTPNCQVSLKAGLLLVQYQREPHGILGLFWTDFPRSFAWGGRKGHCLGASANWLGRRYWPSGTACHG
jgi:hypothetical protein